VRSQKAVHPAPLLIEIFQFLQSASSFCDSQSNRRVMLKQVEPPAGSSIAWSFAPGSWRI